MNEPVIWTTASLWWEEIIAKEISNSSDKLHDDYGRWLDGCVRTSLQRPWHLYDKKDDNKIMLHKRWRPSYWVVELLLWTAVDVGTDYITQKI